MSNIITRVYQNKDKTIIYQEKEIDKFIVKGKKVYANSLEKLIEDFTKKEVLLIIELMNNTSAIGYYNILKVPFRMLFKDMNKSMKSRLKKKLFDSKVLAEYKGIIMINPFIMVPKQDKNVKNSQYLAQRVWVYLFEDKDKVFDGYLEAIEYIFEEPK